MKILVETSVLVGASVFWEYEDAVVKQPTFEKCNKLFDFLRKHPENGIITKTVEDEAKSALNKVVVRTVAQTYCPDIVTKAKIMTLQHIITNSCLDRLEKLVEECSTRLPINIEERTKIKDQEIEPFLKEIVPRTIRYIQPTIPGFIKDVEFRGELTEIIVKSLPTKGVVYKGMPAGRDLTIMAEASMIYRKFSSKEKVYVASLDNHFIPNRIQMGSYLSGYMKQLDDLDPTVRDELATRFGFIGEDPTKVLEIAEKELNK